ncbi:hypothetical protein DFH27DRAFT_237394 [Peziza echinospora]|nr:hypothetical protein DFH27DRAFT_237394 [Peziza echinospora]
MNGKTGGDLKSGHGFDITYTLHSRVELDRNSNDAWRKKEMVVLGEGFAWNGNGRGDYSGQSNQRKLYDSEGWRIKYRCIGIVTEKRGGKLKECGRLKMEDDEFVKKIFRFIFCGFAFRFPLFLLVLLKKRRCWFRFSFYFSAFCSFFFIYSRFPCVFTYLLSCMLCFSDYSPTLFFYFLSTLFSFGSSFISPFFPLFSFFHMVLKNKIARIWELFFLFHFQFPNLSHDLYILHIAFFFLLFLFLLIS